ncbi:basic, immunoglobulin-like variable motif-containing [Plakobranchus ocellatus]|uniref:Basic, immunoglobulin-like variable motif-containing n=1 Tax=Plakobranchus ocellatus TaxID=259542 RepID=A0AAV4CAM4_9GAST|nr:basic, immunoglobulin-like variable motif-containing [Plakobranchus ocellatus]
MKHMIDEAQKSKDYKPADVGCEGKDANDRTLSPKDPLEISEDRIRPETRATISAKPAEAAVKQDDLVVPSQSHSEPSPDQNLIETDASSIAALESNSKSGLGTTRPSGSKSERVAGTAAGATAAQTGKAPAQNDANDDSIDHTDLDIEQRRALERLDSDLSTFEAVEQCILEASEQFDKDQQEQLEEEKISAEASATTQRSAPSSGIPRLQRPTPGRPRTDSSGGSRQEDANQVIRDPEEGQNDAHAYSSPVDHYDEQPPSPSTHQLVRSFSGEEDGGIRGNMKRGVSPRRHSGIPVRQGSLHGINNAPSAAAYLVYPGDSDSTTTESDVPDRPNGAGYTRRGGSVSSDGGTNVDDFTISDLTGRARKSKKRSGIPAAWLGKSPDGSPHYSRSSSPGVGEQYSLSDKNRPLLDKKVLDLKRWYCMCRPQYKTSCGISSVVSCWNYLFSTLGHGSLKPLTQETAMSILGFPEPFSNIKFGPFTGNLTLLRWFQELNTNFRVKGKCYFMYKPVGKNSTPGVTSEMALASLRRGLRDPSMTFIYHCQNHYFCPIGYDDTPTNQQDAYRSVADDSKETWILIGDTSKNYPAIHCKSWKNISLDLNCKNPEHYNIREEWKGVRTRKVDSGRQGNLHCIMVFEKVNGGFCSPPSSLYGRQSQSGARPSRLPVTPGNATSRSPPPEPLCECDEPGPVLEEEEVGLEDLDSSFDANDEDNDYEEDGESNREGEKEREGRNSEDGRI